MTMIPYGNRMPQGMLGIGSRHDGYHPSVFMTSKVTRALGKPEVVCLFIGEYEDSYGVLIVCGDWIWDDWGVLREGVKADTYYTGTLNYLNREGHFAIIQNLGEDVLRFLCSIMKLGLIYVPEYAGKRGVYVDIPKEV